MSHMTKNLQPDAALVHTGVGHDGLAKEPNGFALRYAVASFGAYFAVFAPSLGGLSVKIQQLVGLDDAAKALGTVMGVGFMAGPLIQPLVGKLSDNTTSRFGMRKPWLILGSIGVMFSLTGVGLATTIPSLTIFWCLTQIFSNIVQGTLNATVADHVPENRLGTVAGIGGAAVPIGKMAAALALFLLVSDWQRLALPGILGGMLCLYFAVTLKDRIRIEKKERISLRSVLSSYSFTPLLYRDYGLAWISKALVMFGIASNTSYLTLYLARSFGMSVPQQLRFNVFATACIVVTTVVGSIIGGRYSDRIGRRKPFVAGGGTLVAMGVLLLAIAPLISTGSSGLALVLCGEAMIGSGFGLFLAVDMALCIDVLPNPETRAKDLGVLSLANSLPGTIAPLAAGVIFVPLGEALHPQAGYPLWFGVASLITMVGVTLVLKIRSVR